MKKYLPRVILYPNREKDREILAWLEQMPSGLKTRTIKDAIWASIKGASLAPSYSPPKKASPPSEYRTTTPPPPPPPQNGTMHGSLSLDTRELLADIRQIVEVGVAQGFAYHGAGFSARSQPEEKDEVEALLDDLNMSFMLDDEEE